MDGHQQPSTLVSTSTMRMGLSTRDFQVTAQPWLELSRINTLQIHLCTLLAPMRRHVPAGESRPNICPSPSPTHVTLKPQCYATSQSCSGAFFKRTYGQASRVDLLSFDHWPGCRLRHGCYRQHVASVAIPECFPPTFFGISDGDPFPRRELTR